MNFCSTPVAPVFLAIVEEQMHILRHFRICCTLFGSGSSRWRVPITLERVPRHAAVRCAVGVAAVQRHLCQRQKTESEKQRGARLLARAHSNTHGGVGCMLCVALACQLGR
jgi:hypothetical protein